MKKTMMRAAGITCLAVLFLGQTLLGQNRLAMAKGELPVASAERFKEVKDKAEIKLQMELVNANIVTNPQMNRGLQRIINSLLLVAPLQFSWTQYKVILVNDINYGATAYQNGTIVIDQNFVCRHSDQMVIYAVGHEIAHIGLRNGVGEDNLKDSLRYELAEFLKTNPSTDEVSKKTQNNVFRLTQYYRFQEKQADIWGIRLMLSLGFRFPDDKELSDFFIDAPYYLPKADRVKFVLNEQKSFSGTCANCPKAPRLDLSKLRMGCYGYGLK